MMPGNYIERIERLPDSYADRLPAPNVDGLRRLASGGEWGELLDALIAGLVNRGMAVSAAERDELVELVGVLSLEATVPPDRLNVAD